MCLHGAKFCVSSKFSDDAEVVYLWTQFDIHVLGAGGQHLQFSSLCGFWLRVLLNTTAKTFFKEHSPFIYLFIYFLSGEPRAVCWILVPSSGMETVPTAVETQSIPPLDCQGVLS